MIRHLPFTRLHNFRDLGGYRTVHGDQLRWGKLYRSDSLAKLAGDDLGRFRELGIRTVIDLRYQSEIDMRGRIPHDDSLTYHHLSIEHRPYDQAAQTADVEAARYLADRYLEVAHDGAVEIRQTLEILAGEDNAPAVFHCASGKDRTGLIAALVLSLTGVSEEDIVADFALTGLATERLIGDFKAFNPGRELVWPGFGTAPAAVMEIFLAELKSQHGSVRAYAARHLGLDSSVVGALRRNLLTSAI